MQKTAYERRISDWSSDVCSSDLQLFMAAIEHELAVVHGVAPAAVGPVHGELPAQLAGHPGIVGVEKGDDLAFGRIDAGVARRRAAAVEIGSASCRERVCQYVSIAV